MFRSICRGTPKQGPFWVPLNSDRNIYFNRCTDHISIEASIPYIYGKDLCIGSERLVVFWCTHWYPILAGFWCLHFLMLRDAFNVPLHKIPVRPPFCLIFVLEATLVVVWLCQSVVDVHVTERCPNPTGFTRVWTPFCYMDVHYTLT